MYDTSGTYSVCYAAPPDVELAGRLHWLSGELARQETPRRAPSVAEEWRAMRSVTLGRAHTPAEAYRWFGTFLGLFPPLAIFARLLGGMYSTASGDASRLFWWGALFLVMSVVCCLVGRALGGALGRKLGDPGERSLTALLLYSLLSALAWGFVTGAAGGAVAFLVGAVGGVFCAVPVALATFPVFTLLHRALARGGMIEARTLWPHACGIPLTAAALILGL